MAQIQMGGYAGSFLHVDLTKGNIEKRPLDPDFARKNLGGLGFGAQIFLDLIKEKPGFDALSADNPFVLMTGPLTGMHMNAVARWTVCAKSPLTGLWGDSNIGGHFGARLKFAGYDGIIITGASDHPVCLVIRDDWVELIDGGPYWGKDTYTTARNMRSDLKASAGTPGKTWGSKGEVLTIGPAGENRVAFACLVHNKGHIAGRTGMGAVWGAKQLKAIYVEGSGRLTPAHPHRLKMLRKELKPLYADSIFIAAMQSSGTPSHMDVGIISGDIPIKNWLLTEWDEIDELGPAAIEEKIFAGNRTCFGCSVACKKEARVKQGPFCMEKGPGPEYETVATFGTLCLNPDIESVAKANEVCNRLGMDTISCGATIAFAIECFENGLITREDTGGPDLCWGNSRAIVTMAEHIGKKQGLGAILCQGSQRAAHIIGKNSHEFLTTVKGLEAPMHDPRNAHGYGLAYGVSPRGACHEASLTFEIEGGAMYIPEIPELADELPDGSQGRARLNVACQDFGMFFSHCAVICNLGGAPLTATHARDMINHVTGFDYTLEELMKIGRRLWYLKRGLTNLFGARAGQDRLPARLMTPLEHGPTRGSLPDMDLMLEEFYGMRGLDADGLPGQQTLLDLGLDTLAHLLHPGA